jgi:hypothetical protein
VEQEAKNNTAFMHYDGTSWQVLPNGLHDTLYDPNAEGVGIVIHDQASGTKYIAQFNTTIMALLGFASPIPLQRRYQPLQVIR